MKPFDQEQPVSSQIIAAARKRFDELGGHKLAWSDFYTGWLEAAMLYTTKPKPLKSNSMKDLTHIRELLRQQREQDLRAIKDIVLEHNGNAARTIVQLQKYFGAYPFKAEPSIAPTPEKVEQLSAEQPQSIKFIFEGEEYPQYCEREEGYHSMYVIIPEMENQYWLAKIDSVCNLDYIREIHPSEIQVVSAASKLQPQQLTERIANDLLEDISRIKTQVRLIKEGNTEAFNTKRPRLDIIDQMADRIIAALNLKQ